MLTVCVVLGNHRVLFHIRADYISDAAMSIDVIGSILRVVLHDEDQSIAANGLFETFSTTIPMA